MKMVQFYNKIEKEKGTELAWKYKKHFFTGTNFTTFIMTLIVYVHMYDLLN